MEIYTWLSRFFPNQFRQPRGRLGKIVGRLESRRNQAANDFALEHLEVEPGQKVLEAGFGPGVTIEKLERLVGGGRVVGVDFSYDMAAQALARNQDGVDAGQILLTIADTCRLPLPTGVFDRVLAVSVVYFFEDARSCLTEILRVLKPGGKLSLYITDKEDLLKVKFTQIGNFRLYSASEAVALLENAGYAAAAYRTRTINARTGICVVGKKTSQLGRTM